MVLTSWLRVIARVHPVHAMNAEQCQMAADLWTKQTDLSCMRACRHLWKYIHHRHLLLLSRKADTHYAILQTAEGRRLSRPRWLVTHPNSLPARRQSPTWKKGKGRCSSSWESHLRAMGRHLPCGITQCYLPPDTSERAPPSTNRAQCWLTMLIEG